MAKVNKYSAQSKILFDAVGGASNIEYFFNCMTRMRFILKDWSIVDEKLLKDSDWVIGINKSESNNQYQVIIGAHVPEFFKIFCETNGYELNGKDKIKIDTNNNSDVKFEISQDAQIAATKRRVRGSGAFAKTFAFISQVFAPIVAPLLGYGLILSIWSLLTVEWSGEGTSLAKEVYFFGQLESILVILTGAFSLFITISIGYTVCKAMGTNPIYGIIVAVIITNPGLTGLGDVKPDAGENLLELFPGWDLFGTGVTYPWKINFNGLMIPMIIVIMVTAYIEKATDKIENQTLKMIVAPLLIIAGGFIFAVFIMAPIGLIFTFWLSEGIGFLSTNDIAKYIAIPVIGGLYGPLVITGLHHSITPIILQGQASMGATLLQGFITLSNISQGVAVIAFVVLFKRVRRLKDLGISNGVSAIVGGITEPALYTINLKHLFPLIAASIGVFSGSVLMVASNSYALQGASSIFGILMFLQNAPEQTGVTTWAGGGILWGTLSIILSCGVTFIMTLVLGKTKYFWNRSKLLLIDDYGVDIDERNKLPKDEWAIIVKVENIEYKMKKTKSTIFKNELKIEKIDSKKASTDRDKKRKNDLLSLNTKLSSQLVTLKSEWAKLDA